jgi:monovalent cation:H+ antiporter-2, CPA2 family
MNDEILLITFTLFLAGSIAVPIATRFGLGSVLGYLLAGIAISPVLGWIGVDVMALQHLTEFGVVMMLFLIGLEMQPLSLWKMRSRIFVMGGGQVALTALAVMGVAVAFDLAWQSALAIGLILALSSTAIVSQTLQEKGLMKSDGGMASLSVLLFQDIAVIPMLVLIPLLALPGLGASGAEAEHASLSLNMVDGLPAWASGLVTLGAVLLVIVVGHFTTTPIFRYISTARLREIFVSTALMMVVGVALLMTMVGLSPALGTFLAGVVMANSPYRHELESDIAPFKGIFLGVFFITVGASIDFELLADHLVLVALLTLGLIVVKMAVLGALARGFGLFGGDRWLVALGLAQAGEFGFVLISFTVGSGVIARDTADLMLLIVTLSMFLTPALFILYDKVVAPRYSRQQQTEADAPPPADIIIAGHGRFGGIVNRALRAAGYRATVVDYSAEQLEILRNFGLPVYYGDATRPDLLEAAGIANARLLVIAIDGKEAVTELVKLVQSRYPHLHVIARAYDRYHVYDLWAIGCRDIIRETYDSSIRASRSAFEALGHSRTKSEAALELFLASDREHMLEMANHYAVSDPSDRDGVLARYVREGRESWEAELNVRIAEILRG